MSNIEDLVPPLELCQKIPMPRKNFRDSYFAWCPRFRGRGEFRRVEYYELFQRPSANDSQCIPSPTLAEILIKLPTVIDYCGAKFFLCMHDRRNGEQHDWQIGYEYASGGGVITSPFIQRDIHPATAALKLWLDAVLRNSNQSDTTDIASNKTHDAGRSDVEEK